MSTLCAERASRCVLHARRLRREFGPEMAGMRLYVAGLAARGSNSCRPRHPASGCALAAARRTPLASGSPRRAKRAAPRKLLFDRASTFDCRDPVVLPAARMALKLYRSLWGIVSVSASTATSPRSAHSSPPSRPSRAAGRPRWGQQGGQRRAGRPAGRGLRRRGVLGQAGAALQRGRAVRAADARARPQPQQRMPPAARMHAPSTLACCCCC
jgi:hypothetical protein